MAMPNKDDPKWFFAEAMRAPHSMDMVIRVAIRGHEGWVKVLDLVQDGWSSASLPTQRQILENIQETTAIELAKLTLEET